MLSKKTFSHICVTDLDGTLLNIDHTISDQNWEALKMLGEANVCRVAATGRSLYSLKKVVSSDTPFDYIVFSTGAGVMNWLTQEIILTRHISKDQIEVTFNKLLKLNEDFMFHAPIPENHHFLAVRGKGLPDFYRRIGFYQEFGLEWDHKTALPWKEGTQFLVVADERETNLYAQLISLLYPLKVIRTTSPIDHKSLWIEIFSTEVSKGSAVEYLLDLLSIKKENLMVIGNDYNDTDMLQLTDNAYVTSNAPEELTGKYQVVADYNNHGFAEAVKHWLKTIY